VACMGEERDEYRVLVGKHEGKGLREDRRRRWEEILKLDGRTWTGSCGWGEGQVADPLQTR